MIAFFSPNLFRFLCNIKNKNMRLLVVFLAGITCFDPLSAQETKKKIVEIRESQFKEVFYVLKNNEEIKHGNYSKTYGPFKVQGQYDNNEKTGIWEYSFETGLEQRIDYSQDSVLFTKPFRALVKSWIVKDDSLIVNDSKKPIYLGGDNRMFYYVLKTLRYPEEARIKKIEGIVFVSAFITESGEMVDAKLEDGPKGGGLSKEALRVIQNIPQDWIAPRIHGKPVKSKVLIQLKFQMPR